MIPPSSEPPDVIAGQYTLQDVIGRGGSSVVYRARDLSGQTVAVKILREEFAGSIGATRFLREVRLLASLRHPNIIPVLDAGESNGRLFVVLPLMEGGTLRTRLDRDKQLPLATAVSIATDLCSALAFAHAQGVVHRDVKPENILFSGEAPCLADFGIARAIERAIEDATTTTGVAMGTPAYMSPEQAAGEKTLDARSDVYSLGCVLYEMIAGMPAFSGPTKQSVVVQHMTHAARPLTVYRASVPPELEQVIDKAMMAERVDRYQSASEFRDALLSAPTEAITRRRPAIPRSTRSLRRRASETLAAAGLIGAAIAATWMLTRGRQPRLDANKVVVFPLEERGTTKPGGTSGADVALLIGSALENTEPLKWIDAWTWLDSAQRADPARVNARQARALARSRGARFYLGGSVVQRADSATVVLQLMDVAGDSAVAQRSATGPSRPEAFAMLGLRAVVQLLPHLVDPTRRIDLRSIGERNPAAIASFLQGESDYRRSDYSNALSHYRRAVEADSGLVFAAVKGAQAANWAEQDSAARELVTLAISKQTALPPKYASFARGLDSFLKGSADSAASEFKRALSVDAGWGEAWTALGEVYFHLFPAGAAWDSVAQVSFERARQEDPEFAPPVFHLTELALRREQLTTADKLLADFRHFHPDSTWVTQLQLTVNCAHGRVDSATWGRLARDYPVEVAKASRSLALLARRYDCAEHGFRAVLDVAELNNQVRWMAALGLQSLLIARGRDHDALTVLDSVVAKGLRQAMAIYIVDAAAGSGADSRAEEAMKLVAGPYEKMPARRLWYHLIWQNHRRALDSLAAIDAVLRSKAEQTSSSDDRFFAGISTANLAIARADTSGAIQLLRGLHPEGNPSGITWDLWQSLAPERLSLARLLLARRDFGEALRVGDSFDHPQPVVDLIYLPASLVIRAQAARELGDRKLEQRYRQQLALLGRTDLLTALH